MTDCNINKGLDLMYLLIVTALLNSTLFLTVSAVVTMGGF